MPIFTPTVASGLTDRVAALVKGVDAIMPAARAASAPGNMYKRVSVGNDYDVEKDLITPTFEFEQILSGTSLFGGVQQTNTLLSALDSHCQRLGAVTFNQYLINSGLQVSEYFARLWGTQRTALSAHNVFIERDVVMASVTKTAGAWVFGAGQDLGSGGITGAYSKDTPNTGEQYIIAGLASGVATNSLVINVSGLDDSGRTNQASVNFTHNISGSQVQVSPTLKFRTITNAQVTGDDGIANGTAIQIFNRRERVVVY